MTDLKREFHAFRALEFPGGCANNDKLDELRAELARLDGEVSGVVTSLLEGRKVDRKVVRRDTLGWRLQAAEADASPTDKAYVSQLVQYFREADKLASMVIEMLS